MMLVSILKLMKSEYTWLFFLTWFIRITSYRLVDWANESDLKLFTKRVGNLALGCGGVIGFH